MSKFKDNLVWFLQEVENAELEYIETGEIEVYGETESGLEGTCTVKISEICGEAAKELEAKDKLIGDYREFLELILHAKKPWFMEDLAEILQITPKTCAYSQCGKNIVIGEEFDITSQDDDFCNQECYLAYCSESEEGGEL